MTRRSRDTDARPRDADLEEEPLLSDHFHTEEETEPGRIGPYELVARFPNTEVIEVFLAHKFSNFGFLRLAVVKRARRKAPGYSENRQLLLDEARAIAFLDHANLVSIIDAGEEEPGTYLAVEYVDGTDLARVNAKLRARGEALPFELACYIAIEILRGLHHAHTATSSEGKALNIVHRDVHPSNVLIARTGHIKLTDFGSAVMRERLQASTQPGVMKGRLAYKAPEYLESKPIDLRMDVYAVGMILFELLTGRPCFSAPSSYELIEKILSRNLRLERMEKEGVPSDLVELVARASHGDVTERYTSAEDFANALETWIIKNSLQVSPWILSAFFKQHGLFDQPALPKQQPLASVIPGAPSSPPPPERTPVPERPTAPPAAPKPLEVDIDVSEEDEDEHHESPTYPGIPRPGNMPIHLDSLGRDETTSPSIPAVGTRPRRPPSDSPTPLPKLEVEPLSISVSERRLEAPTVGRVPEAPRPEELLSSRLRAAALKTGDLVLPPLLNKPAASPKGHDEVESKRKFNAPTERIRASEASDRAARLIEAAKALETERSDRFGVDRSHGDRQLGEHRDRPAKLEARVRPADLPRREEQPITAPEVADLVSPPPPRVDHVMNLPKGPLVVAEVFPDRVEMHAPAAPAGFGLPSRIADTVPEKSPVPRLPTEPPDLPALPDVPAVPMAAFHEPPVRFTVEAMSGELSTSTPREILEKLVRLGATGKATFTTGPIWKAIALREGKPLAISSNMGMEILGEQLVLAKLLTRADLDRAMRESSGGDEGLVAKLLKYNLVERGALARQLGEIVTLRLSDMLDWSDGTYEFTPLLPPEPPLRPDIDMLVMLDSSRSSLAPKPRRMPSEEPPPSAASKPSLKRVLDMARKVNEAGKGRPDDLTGIRKKPQ